MRINAADQKTFKKIKLVMSLALFYLNQEPIINHTCDISRRTQTSRALKAKMLKTKKLKNKPSSN